MKIFKRFFSYNNAYCSSVCNKLYGLYGSEVKCVVRL